MYSCTPNRLPTFLLVLVLGITPAFARDDVDEQSAVTSAQTEDLITDPTDPTESEALKEQQEKNADVREAVLENLDLKEMTDEYDDDTTDSIEPDAEKPSQQDETLVQGEEQEEWYSRFTPIVEKMQDIPYLSERGWLHFGRVEFEYGHFSKSELLEGDSGFNFRSLRSGIIKLFDSGTIVKLDIDLTDGDSNFTDLYARFSTKLGLFTLGNQKVALSLVNQTSRLARTFMEEPLPAEAFGLVRRLGLG